MRLLFSLACAATLTVGALRADDLVVRAGTIHPCGGEAALTDGAAIWIQDGKIIAVGKDVDAPAGTPELDFGSTAVIAPGLVATKSAYGPRGDAARVRSLRHLQLRLALRRDQRFPGPRVRRAFDLRSRRRGQAGR